MDQSGRAEDDEESWKTVMTKLVRPTHVAASGRKDAGVVLDESTQLGAQLGAQSSEDVPDQQSQDWPDGLLLWLPNYSTKVVTDKTPPITVDQLVGGRT